MNVFRTDAEWRAPFEDDEQELDLRLVYIYRRPIRHDENSKSQLRERNHL
jgi:hypothetical protein